MSMRHELLMELLEPPAAEKAKEAEPFTCKYKGSTREYTDARDSGGSTKKNYGFCSSGCREVAKKTPRARAQAPEAQAQGLRHGLLPARAPEAPVQGLRCGLLPDGRQKGRCNDCGTCKAKGMKAKKGTNATASTGARSTSAGTA
jgi:hypothetical protein